MGIMIGDVAAIPNWALEVSSQTNTMSPEIVSLLSSYGIGIKTNPLLILYEIDGLYQQDQKIISISVSYSLPIFFHELGHAIEDLMGVLDFHKRRTGEFTAYLFMNMMAFRETNPSLVLGKTFDNYLYSNVDNICKRNGDPIQLDVEEAKERARAAYKHSLATKVRHLLGRVSGEAIAC